MNGASNEGPGSKVSGHVEDSKSLLACAKNGDRDAFWMLAARFEPRWYKIIARVLREQSMPDVLQDAYLAAWKNFNSFRGETIGQCYGWLERIIWRKACDHVGRNIRRRTKESPYPTYEEADWQPSDPLCETPSSFLSNRELCATVAVLLEGLSETDQRVVSMRVQDGCTHEEIAAATQMTPTAVRQRFSRAIRQLREKLEHSL